jgi:hypothetical protein
LLIEDYFNQIEAAAASSAYVISARIFRDKRSLYIAYIEGEIQFQDESILFFMEFVDVSKGVDRYKYKYQYQDKDGIRIFRYDMAPHHPEVETFPHHKHVGPESTPNRVTESPVPSLREVLEEIGEIVSENLL